MKKYFNRTVVPVIMAAMVVNSAGVVYADDDISYTAENSGTVSEAVVSEGAATEEVTSQGAGTEELVTKEANVSAEETDTENADMDEESTCDEENNDGDKVTGDEEATGEEKAAEEADMDGNDSEKADDANGAEKAGEEKEDSNPNGSEEILPAYITITTASGKCGENLTWRLENGTLTISGTGPMEDYDITLAPWCDRNENGEWHCYDISKVVIEKGVTSISGSAFLNTLMKRVEIAETVTSIGRRAFSRSSVRYINLPKGITVINPITFYECYGLVSIEIPEGVTSIGEGAFLECNGLKSVEIPERVESIGEHAFLMCTDLKSIVLPKGISNIGEGAFLGCDQLTDIYFTGSEADWAKIIIGNDNPALANAVIHFNYSRVATQDSSYERTVTSGSKAKSTLRILSQPVDTASALSEKLTFKVKAENVASYQWEYSEDQGKSWKSLENCEDEDAFLSGATSDELTLMVDQERSDYIYRCKLTGEDGTVTYTDSVKILLTNDSAEEN